MCIFIAMSYPKFQTAPQNCTFGDPYRIYVLHFFCIVGHLSTKKGVYVHFHNNVISDWVAPQNCTFGDL